jgi:hypothetical protein
MLQHSTVIYFFGISVPERFHYYIDSVFFFFSRLTNILLHFPHRLDSGCSLTSNLMVIMMSIIMVTVIMVTVLFLVILAVIVVVSGMSGGFVVQSIMMITSVLHFSGVDWHSLVDGWVMVAQFAVVAQIVVSVMVAVVGLFVVLGLLVVRFGHIVAMAGSLGVGGSMSSLGVLYGGCVDGHSVVDHWHVVVISRTLVVMVLLGLMIMWVFGGFGHGRKMFGAGMLYFNWFYRDSVLDDWIMVSIFAIIFLIMMIVMMMIFLMGLFVLVATAQIMTVRITASLGDSRKVFGLSVSNFRCFLNFAIFSNFGVSAMM